MAASLAGWAPGDGVSSDSPQIVWSPDGTQLAFNLPRAGSAFPLFVMNADRTGVTKLPISRHAVPPIAWQPVP
jgi:hypothetical protein